MIVYANLVQTLVYDGHVRLTNCCYEANRVVLAYDSYLTIVVDEYICDGIAVKHYIQVRISTDYKPLLCQFVCWVVQ